MKKRWPEIWLEIAEAFGTPRDERTMRECEIKDGGLCNSLFTLAVYGDINSIERTFCNLGYSMGIIGYDDYCSWWPSCESKYDQARSDFACLMAALSHDEFEELLQWAGGQ